MSFPNSCINKAILRNVSSHIKTRFISNTTIHLPCSCTIIFHRTFFSRLFSPFSKVSTQPQHSSSTTLTTADSESSSTTTTTTPPQKKLKRYTPKQLERYNNENSWWGSIRRLLLIDNMINATQLYHKCTLDLPYDTLYTEFQLNDDALDGKLLLRGLHLFFIHQHLKYRLESGELSKKEKKKYARYIEYLFYYYWDDLAIIISERYGGMRVMKLQKHYQQEILGIFAALDIVINRNDNDNQRIKEIMGVCFRTFYHLDEQMNKRAIYRLSQYILDNYKMLQKLDNHSFEYSIFTWITCEQIKSKHPLWNDSALLNDFDYKSDNFTKPILKENTYYYDVEDYKEKK